MHYGNIQEDEIVALIFFGSVGILLLIIGIAVFLINCQRRMMKHQQKEQQLQKEYQQQMIQLQLESQENERKRIAADLHDSVGSLLWGAKLTAAYMERSTESFDKTHSMHEELMNILDQSIQTVKQISWELTPEAFQYSGLSVSVAALCKRFDGKGMHVYFDETDSRIWKGNRAILAFRIIQELISNSVKHSKASQLLVHFTWGDNFLNIKVVDDGIGFDVDEKRNGVGWWNIDQRVKLLEATIEIVKIPMSQGTHIDIIIPLLNEQ